MQKSDIYTYSGNESLSSEAQLKQLFDDYKQSLHYLAESIIKEIVNFYDAQQLQAVGELAINLNLISQANTIKQLIEATHKFQGVLDEDKIGFEDNTADYFESDSLLDTYKTLKKLHVRIDQVLDSLEIASAKHKVKVK